MDGTILARPDGSERLRTAPDGSGRLRTAPDGSGPEPALFANCVDVTVKAAGLCASSTVHKRKAATSPRV